MDSFVKFLLVCILLCILVIVFSVASIGAVIAAAVGFICGIGLKSLLCIAAVIFCIWMIVKFFNEF